MSTALIVTVDLGGNLPPVLGIGLELQRRGWRVVLHGDAAANRAAADLGLPTVLAEGVPYDPAEPRNMPQALRDIPRLWADRGRGRHAVAEASRLRADVVVVDVLLVGALAELERAEFPTVVVGHSSWEGVDGFLGGPMGAAVRARGVAAKQAVAAASLVLVASPDRLGRPVALPANARATGAVLQEEPGERARTARPLVLVSLSSVAFRGQREALQTVLDAVASLPVDVRAGYGRAVDPAGLRVAANTVLEQRIDHAALMPQASAIVTHGGHATAVRALANGLPMLVIPMHPMMDQPRIGAAVAAAGAGLTLPKSASVEAVRAALQRLLSTPSFRTAADAFGAEIVAQGGAARAGDEIEALVGARSPA